MQQSQVSRVLSRCHSCSKHHEEGRKEVHPHVNRSESSLSSSDLVQCIAIATDSAAHQPPPHTTAALKMTSSVVQCSFVHINSDCTVHTQVVETTVVHTKLLHTTRHQ